MWGSGPTFQVYFSATKSENTHTHTHFITVLQIKSFPETIQSTKSPITSTFITQFYNLLNPNNFEKKFNLYLFLNTVYLRVFDPDSNGRLHWLLENLKLHVLPMHVCMCFIHGSF